MADTVAGATPESKNDPSAHLSSARVPVHNWRAHWLTVQEFSRMMGRRPFTVHWWLRNGTLAEFGIPVYRVRDGRLHSGRAFIRNIF